MAILVLFPNLPLSDHCSQFCGCFSLHLPVLPAPIYMKPSVLAFNHGSACLACIWICTELYCSTKYLTRGGVPLFVQKRAPEPFFTKRLDPIVLSPLCSLWAIVHLIANHFSHIFSLTLSIVICKQSIVYILFFPHTAKSGPQSFF